MSDKSLIILGIRNIPASHGGFETFAENLSIYLVERGWDVTVYCQESNDEMPGVCETMWEGVRRVHIGVSGNDAKATVVFDYLSIRNALGRKGLVLTLGYNTALFNLWFRVAGRKNLINMDGIEWRRDKWSWYEKAWLYLNERVGCLVGSQLIADHPEISNHLATRVRSNKLVMIPYGARRIDSADIRLLDKYDLKKREYAMVVARPEPENSIWEIVSAFSAKPRGKSLVVLGNYDETNSYHRRVLNDASKEVRFLGAIYDHDCLDALRFYSCLYLHGHTVGGTNPSLVEALGAGQPVMAQDNKYNRWVAGAGAVFFRGRDDCSRHLDALLSNERDLLNMAMFSRKRFEKEFTWDIVLRQYEELLLQWK